MVVWGVLEFGIHTLRPDTIQREEKITQTFRETSNILWNKHARLQIQSLEILDKLSDNIIDNSISPSFFKTINNRPMSEALAIYKDGRLVMWSDGLTKELNEYLKSNSTVLNSDDVGLYILASTSKQSNDTHWQVVNASIVFEIANPGSRFGDVYQPVDRELKRLTPQPFYLEGSPDLLPSDYRFNLITLYDDVTSGYFVLNVSDTVVRSFIHPNLDLGIRTLFFLLFVIIAAFITQLHFSKQSPIRRTFGYSSFIWLVFLSMHYLGVAMFIVRLLSGDTSVLSSYESSGLFYYIKWSIPFIITVMVLISALLETKRYYGFTWYPRTIAFSVIFGATSGFMFGMFNKVIRYLSRIETVEIVDLSLIPSVPTIWLFIVTGLFGVALIIGTIAIAWFLMNSEEDQLSWMHPLVVVGFVFSYISNQNMTTVPLDGRLFEIIWVATFFALCYYAAYQFHLKPHLLRFYSALRVIALMAFLIAAISFPSYYSSVNAKYESAMKSLAESTLNPDYWRSSDDYTMQSPFLIVVYENDIVVGLTGDFAAGQFPDNAILPPNASNLTRNSQSIYSIQKGDHFYYRELIYRASSTKYVVIQTRLQNFNNYLYSFFRFYLYLIVLGFSLYALYEYLVNSKFIFIRSRESFQTRIQDTYILSSFLFLFVLVVATQEIIKNQNARNIELELVENLNLLQFGMQSEGNLTVREDLFLGFDYLYYTLDESPITLQPVLAYSLGLSGILPYNVYNEIVNERRLRKLQWINSGKEQILLGFRAVIPENEVANAVVAIPVLPSSKKYMDQVLQTVSFLIVLYLIIFGLFLVGGIFISREIMRPIHEFKRGLQRISTGQLDTMIPVTSQDEIGELANSYNLMVFKLKDLQEELAESERQTAWTEMARQVAHEIKNPLTPMKLSIQHLYQQVEYGEKTMEDIRPIVRRISNTLIQEIDSLSNIASDFSKFARPIMEEFVEADINTIINDVIELYRHEKRVQLYFDPSPYPIFAMIAIDELKRVFINLIKNSMEAVGRTGLIILRTYTFDRNAYIEVIDNGSGMSQNVMQKIFIPNFSTKNTGTGLGLAICKKVVAAHSGSIQFASAKSIGTTFTITLPLKEQK